MPSSLGVQFLYSVDKQQEFRTLAIGIVAQSHLRTLQSTTIIGIACVWRTTKP